MFHDLNVDELAEAQEAGLGMPTVGNNTLLEITRKP